MSFEKLAGIYVYAMDYHGGQWSRLYRLQCRIGRVLAISDRAIAAIRRGRDDRNNEWEESRRVYRALKRRKSRMNKTEQVTRALLDTWDAPRAQTQIEASSNYIEARRKAAEIAERAVAEFQAATARLARP